MNQVSQTNCQLVVDMLFRAVTNRCMLTGHIQVNKGETKGIGDIGGYTLLPKSTCGGRRHPYYNLVQLVKLLNVLPGKFKGAYNGAHRTKRDSKEIVSLN